MFMDDIWSAIRAITSGVPNANRTSGLRALGWALRFMFDKSITLNGKEVRKYSLTRREMGAMVFNDQIMVIHEEHAVTSKMAPIATAKEGVTRRRLIFDCRASGANSRTRRP